MKLTKLERLLLMNQYYIRKAVEPQDAEFFNEAIEILNRGYEIFYDDLVGAMSADMPLEDSRFVLEVLDMYRAIEDYKERYPQDVATSQHLWSHFGGFDGNNEGSCLAFTRFLIKKQEKFQEQLPYERRTDGYNSHMPTREIYARMLARYQAFGEPHPLTGEMVAEILQAAHRTREGGTTG